MMAGPPPLRRLLGEARFVTQWRTGHNYYRQFEGRSDDGRRETVLVLPGFLATDWMTGPLRRALAAAGYDVHGWGLGRNRGIRPGVLYRPDAKDRNGSCRERVVPYV